MQQIYKFEAKLSQGAAEQIISREIHRCANRLDFFRMLSFYHGGLGFYVNTLLTVWTVYLFVYCNLLLSLFHWEKLEGPLESITLLQVDT